MEWTAEHVFSFFWSVTVFTGLFCIFYTLVFSVLAWPGCSFHMIAFHQFVVCLKFDWSGCLFQIWSPYQLNCCKILPGCSVCRGFWFVIWLNIWFLTHKRKCMLIIFSIWPLAWLSVLDKSLMSQFSWTRWLWENVKLCTMLVQTERTLFQGHGGTRQLKLKVVFLVKLLKDHASALSG